MRSRWSFMMVTCMFAGGCAYGGIGSWTTESEAADAAVNSRPPDAGHAWDSASESDSGSWMPPDASTTPDASAPPDASQTSCTLHFDFGTPTCNACMGQQCCTPDNACGNDTSCMSLVQCLSQCGPPGPDAGTTCQDGCTRSYGSAIGELNAISSCIQAQCIGSCM